MDRRGDGDAPAPGGVAAGTGGTVDGDGASGRAVAVVGNGAVHRLGFALGTALALTAVVGIPLRFAIPSQNVLLSFGAVFLLGAALGAFAYSRRKVGGS